MYILLICGGLLILGYRVSIITFKSEICMAAINLTIYDEQPVEGNGISKFVVSVDNQKKLNLLKRQTYSMAIGANSAYIIYLNRLAALNRMNDWTNIINGYQIKTLMDNFLKTSETDPILRTQFYVISDIWKMIIYLRRLIKNSD